jgi:hypothetical protein
MIFISSGDKGGTGKSMVSALAVDWAITAGRSVKLLEGDSSQPDVAARYSGTIETAALNLNRAGAADAAITALGTYVEQEIDRDDLLVVNLPAGAADTIDQHADLLATVFKDIGHDLVVSYSTGMSAQSTSVLGRSLKSGLMSVADRRTVLIPEMLGDPESFDWTRSNARSEYMAAAGHEAVMPALRPAGLRDKLLSSRGTFRSLTSSHSDLFLIERAQIHRWLAAVSKVITQIMGVES